MISISGLEKFMNDMEKYNYNPSFLELRKYAKNLKDNDIKATLTVIGDCATQHISTAIQGYSCFIDYPLKVYDADYNQLNALILDNNSELYINNPDFVFLLMSSEMLKASFDSFDARNNFAEHQFSIINNYWNKISEHSNTIILQSTYVEVDDAVYGNYALKTQESFLFQVKKLNYLICEGSQKYKNLFLIDVNKIATKEGYKNMHDSKLYYMAKLPFKTESLSLIAKNVLDVIRAIKGVFKKCIICDLDNTLWGGVIGDDGINGIQIGDLGSGHAFDDLQHWLKSLKERGIILAICSKNEESTAKEPFIKHPEMVLSLDDISFFVANWEDKASNIKLIQKTLNIGMDSIVFIDDNPFERNLVRNTIAEITVPELPDDPSLYLEYLKSLNLFETASYSETDKVRTKQYQTEVARITLERSFEDYNQYLESLEMVASSCPFDDFHAPRIAQLTQRSNQFNLRTLRCTEGDIKNYSVNNDFITRYYTLRDKFGDYGLISVLLLKKDSDKTLFIENWLMSCRVLKRGVEEFVINDIVRIAKENGFQYVKGEYIATAKNAMVKDIYQNNGFAPLKNSTCFLLNIDDYCIKKTYIKSENYG